MNLTAPLVRLVFMAGCLSALAGVALGAFAAHALKTRLPADLFTIFEVGVRYQMYHAFALLSASWAMTRWESGYFTVAALMFAAGTIIFSGSLYVLSLSGIRWLGAVTPAGGLCFLTGWFLLAAGVWKSRG